MYESLIKTYVNRLTINDVINFANKENVLLNDKEARIIYDYIKNDWQTIVFGNPLQLFNEFKSKVSSRTYEKTVELYNKYKSKIS